MNGPKSTDLWPTAALPGPRDPTITPYIIEIERKIASGEHKRIVGIDQDHQIRGEPRVIDARVLAAARELLRPAPASGPPR